MKQTINQTEASLSCVHYWLIPVSEGPTSQGRCQHCGSLREFKNHYTSDEIESALGYQKRQKALKARRLDWQ